MITEEIWALAPQLLHVFVGPEEEEEGGYGFEHLSSTIDFWRNIFRYGGEQLFARKIGDEVFIDVLMRGFAKCIDITNNFDYSQTGTISVFLILPSFFENNSQFGEMYLKDFLKLAVEQLARKGTTAFSARVI